MVLRSGEETERDSLNSSAKIKRDCGRLKKKQKQKTTNICDSSKLTWETTCVCCNVCGVTVSYINPVPNSQSVEKVGLFQQP